ncbi:MAG TPA: DNA integrity scanning protein DisA nucleotide-binding domain protein [Acidimicrobiales bacterium]|nr:DNA integrity scanning protein DisA nucleotide-binding domain protein [Acidimicrobiales bacterium]
MVAPQLSRPIKRLLSELKDDGIVIDAHDEILGLLLPELEYARHPQRFERRTPLYGAMVVPHDRALVEAGELVDLVPVEDMPLDVARRFADGRSVFLAVGADGTRMLGCFRRSMQYEADLVEVQSDTGALIVQRTPVLGVTRLFTAAETIEWSGGGWTRRPTARTQQARLAPLLPDIASPVLGGLLELAVHWLSPGRVGAILVVPVTRDATGLDLEHAVATPDLSVTARHHYPALLAALVQTDLATVVDAAGHPHHMGVGLHWSAEAEQAVDVDGGMRHRSAARYTYDNPDAVAVVVSEDGPVTVFRHGTPLSTCAASRVDATVAETV